MALYHYTHKQIGWIQTNTVGRQRFYGAFIETMLQIFLQKLDGVLGGCIY